MLASDRSLARNDSPVSGGRLRGASREEDRFLPADSSVLTTRFAPAYPQNNENSDGRRFSPRSPYSPSHSSLRPSDAASTRRRPNLSTMMDMYGTNNQRLRYAPRPSTDGLGDRQRSFSPDGDYWETFVSTIAPDEHLPSADSSFTSASASATASAASRSAVSGNTDLTDITSDSGGQDPTTVCEPSDTEYESDINTAFERYQRSLRSDRRPHRLPWSDSHATEPSHDEPPIPDEQVDHMQAILERLGRREHVPDHWWARAGLGEEMAGRLAYLERRVSGLESRRTHSS